MAERKRSSRWRCSRPPSSFSAQSQRSLRGKIGTPTIRETPDGEPKSTMLTYEATEGDKRLEVFLENDKVTQVSMY